MLFLRKRNREQPFWDWVPGAVRHGHPVPAALGELVRDDQIVIGPHDAAHVLAYLRGDLGFDDQDTGDGNVWPPVEVVDGDGQRVAL